jgi:hypothetical protein
MTYDLSLIARHLRAKHFASLARLKQWALNISHKRDQG